MRLALLLSLLAVVAQSQTRSTAQTSFEAASLKVSTSGDGQGARGGPGTSDPTMFTYQSATLEDLIAFAYHVDYFQISSRVKLDRQEFDLAAKVPLGVTRDQFRIMLRNLLAERFAMRAHLEKRDFPGYELRVAKGGVKLRQTPGVAGFPELPPGKSGVANIETPSGGYFLVRLRAQQLTMAAFANGLHTPDDQPIADRTGLTGRYDFTFEYTYEKRGSAADPGLPAPVAPDVFTALRQQLGLQLVRAKVPLTVVVVDSTNLLPTEN